MRRRAIILVVQIFLLGLAAPVGAVTEVEQTFLNLYFSPEELHVVSTTRSLKSINRIAENVQVISAADIALLQAHSLAEVLETATGLSIEHHGGTGSLFSPYIQGSEYTQVAAFLDGLPLNSLGGNFPEVTFLSVEEIARIEVIKGPASSAWGSALGGVINIITKNPPEAPGHEGSISASAGKAGTTDFRARVAGRAGDFGYALTAGRLDSDGFVDGYNVGRTAITTKLAYRPSPAWNLGFALYYTNTDRGEGLYPADNEADRSESEDLRAQLTGEGFLAGGGLLSFNLWGAHNDDCNFADDTRDGSEIYRDRALEKMGGAGLRYRRSFAGHDLVLGGDYKTGSSEMDSIPETVTEQKWALYLNDTFDLGPITVTAGLRYDDLESTGDFWSPSLGAVWRLGSHLLLRGDIGRGFTTPLPGTENTNPNWFYVGNPDLGVETVTSYQGGFEGDAPGFFWYKVTLFRHDVKNGITAVTLDDAGTWTYVNKDKTQRQGVEVDLRSVAFHGLALEGGGTLIDVDNKTSGNEGERLADAMYRIGLSYSGGRGLRVLLNLHYTHWKAPEGYQAAADPIVDLHASQEVAVDGLKFEIFGSAHNLFDGDQYYHYRHPNPEPWLEAGLRFKF